MLLCGKIVNTHGISGEVKALYYADSPSFFDKIKEFTLKDKSKLSVSYIKPHKGSILIKFKGIDSFDDAEKLKNEELFVPREKAEKLPEGRYYIVDILGLSVITDTGRNLGKVIDVFKTGSNDVYTVKDENGKEYLIPVIDEVILDTDIKGGRILIKPLKGLLDDED